MPSHPVPAGKLELQADSPRLDSLRLAPLFLAMAAGMLPLLANIGHGFYRDDITWFHLALDALPDPAAVLAPWRAAELRPLGQVLYALEVALFGLRPLLFNLVSLALHAWITVSVFRLAGLLGLSRTGSAIAAGFFLVGAGHLGKPVSWACSQSHLLSTAFVLTSFTGYLAARRLADPSLPPRKAAGIYIVPLIWIGLALASHENAVFGVIGLSFFAWAVRDRLFPYVGLLGLAAAAAYALTTREWHSQHQAATADAGTVLCNAWTYLSGYLVPAQASAAAIAKGGVEGLAGRIVQALFAVGSVAILGILLVAGIRSSRLAAAGVMAGFLALAPALLYPVPAGWVEVRYLYIFSALATPVVVMSALRLRAAAKPWRFGGGIISGIVVRVHRRRFGHDPEKRPARGDRRPDAPPRAAIAGPDECDAGRAALDRRSEAGSRASSMTCRLMRIVVDMRWNRLLLSALQVKRYPR